MKNIIQRNSLLIYFILAFTLFWISLPLSSVSPTLPLAIGTFVPAISAILAATFEGGKAGFVELIRLLGIWRVSGRWYLTALFTPVVVGILVNLLVGDAKSTPASLVSLISVQTILFFIFAAGEELGWRGFALPRLLSKSSPLFASLILGVIHAIWHWPLLLLPGQALTENPLFAHALIIIANAVIYTWIFLHTNSSALLATILHGAFNSTSVLYSGMDPALANWLQAGFYSLIAVAIILVTKTRLTLKAGEVQE